MLSSSHHHFVRRLEVAECMKDDTMPRRVKLSAGSHKERVLNIFMIIMEICQKWLLRVGAQITCERRRKCKAV